MNDFDTDLREVPVDAGDSGQRLQESVVGDVAAVTSAVVSTLGYVQQSVAMHRYRAHLADEMAELRWQLEMERQQRIVDSYGLGGPDGYGGDYSGLGDFDPDRFTGFDVEDY